MNRRQQRQRVAIVTACMRPDGLPTFALNHVEVTAEEYENGVHYALVERLLAQAGCYEEPYVHFTERESPAFLLPAVQQYLGLTSHPQEDQPGLELLK